MHNRSLSPDRSSGMTDAKIDRRYPIGAELIGNGRAHFRVWAPKAKRLEVVIEGEWENSRGTKIPPTFADLECDAAGYFSGAINAKAGTLYRFRLDGAKDFHPDPASRFQPDGPHGASEIIDPADFTWSDQDWRGIEHERNSVTIGTA